MVNLPLIRIQITQGLLAHGFTQSKSNCCLFLHHDCLMVMYTNDCFISLKMIVQLTTRLWPKYCLKDLGTVNPYLSIHTTKGNKTKTITMVQTGFIDSILNEIHLYQAPRPRIPLPSAYCTQIGMETLVKNSIIINLSLETLLVKLCTWHPINSTPGLKKQIIH
jgi:hypothetical protein